MTARDAFAEERITYLDESSSCTNRSNLDNSDGTHTRPGVNFTGLIGVVWPVPVVVATHSLITIAAEFTRARSDNAVGSTSTSVLAKATRAWASVAIWPAIDGNLHSGRAHRTPAR